MATPRRSSNNGAVASAGDAKVELKNNRRKSEEAAAGAAAAAGSSSSGRRSTDLSSGAPPGGSDGSFSGRANKEGVRSTGLAEDVALMQAGSKQAEDLLAAIQDMQADKAVVASWKKLAPPLPATVKAGHLEFDPPASMKWMANVSRGWESCGVSHEASRKR
jgi:hypothetical protein